MNLEELKAKFRHKTSVDMKDVDLALKAVPYLVRELENLERRLQESEKKYEHLADLVNKKRPPLAKEGQRGKARWKVRADEEKNRLYVELAGTFDNRSAKLASSSIIAILPNLRESFEVINDIRELETVADKRTLFHIRKVMYHLTQVGVGKTVRVISPDKGSMNGIFDAGAKEAGLKTVKADSIENAEAMLESVGKFLKA